MHFGFVEVAMTEEKPLAEASGSELRTLVTLADLEAMDFEAPIRSLNIADAHEFYSVHEQAFVAAREAKDEAAQIVYRLFGQLCPHPPIAPR